MKQVYSGIAGKMSGTMAETHCICLIKKAILSIIMFMVISSFIISKNVSALELSLISPENIEMDNEFQTEINIDSEEKYDVKIFVHNSPDSGVTRDEYISQIFNIEKNNWQSSWNYLSGSYPHERKYSLKVLESPGERKICARVRKTGTDSIISKCNTISIYAGNNIEDPIDDNDINSGNNEDDGEELNKPNKGSNNKDNKESNKPGNDIKYANDINDQNKIEELSFIENERQIYENSDIILKSDKNVNQKVKNLENEVYVTKKQKTNLLIFYISNLFLLFIIVLIILKKI